MQWPHAHTPSYLAENESSDKCNSRFGGRGGGERSEWNVHDLDFVGHSEMTDWHWFMTNECSLGEFLHSQLQWMSDHLQSLKVETNAMVQEMVCGVLNMKWDVHYRK